jgi:hypothetical protein
MSQTKIYRVEIAEGDQLYVADDVQATSQEQAIKFSIILFGGLVDEFSEIVKLEERTIH